MSAAWDHLKLTPKQSRRLERWLIRHRILATPEEDAYFDWADRWQDHRDAERRG